jgi:hypothetical protein
MKFAVHDFGDAAAFPISLSHFLSLLLLGRAPIIATSAKSRGLASNRACENLFRADTASNTAVPIER